MKVSEKIAYLRGMVEGMELDLTSTKEGKVLGRLLEVLGDLGKTVDDLQDEVREMNDYVLTLEDAVEELEEKVFGIEDEWDDDEDWDESGSSACYVDEDADEDADEDEDGAYEEQYEAICPTCNNHIVLNDFILDAGEIQCPCCGTSLEFDFDDVEDIDELDNLDK